jgi:diacylglycerol O-acyltransferase / wax synthase
VSAVRHSLSSADTAWLHMDRPTNLMVINAVLLFDEPLDWERLIEVLRERLVGRHPRFREHVVEGGILVGGAHWQEDPDFDLARHVHRRDLPSPRDESALQALAGDLASIPLDRDRPLWEMYVVDGPGSGSAVIARMHHCIADGIALAELMLSLTDSRADARVRREPIAPRGREESVVRIIAAERLGALGESLSAAYDSTATALGATRRLTDAFAHELSRTLTHPRHGVELAGDLAQDARTLGKLLLTAPDARSVLKRDFDGVRGVAWSRPLSLDRVKRIAHQQEATVNDVLLAAVTGALRDYLRAHGEEPHEIRALVPVNLRPPGEPASDELGNRFGLVYLTLPVDRSSRRERLQELKRRMDAIKRSPEGPVSYAMLEAAGRTPVEVEQRIVDFFTSKATAVMTNVPGPQRPAYLAGSPLRAVLVWAPTAGSIGTSVSIFSYAGRITIGLLVHAALVPDPQTIVERLHREVTAMARLAPRAERPRRAPERRTA